MPAAPTSSTAPEGRPDTLVYGQTLDQAGVGRNHGETVTAGVMTLFKPAATPRSAPFDVGTHVGHLRLHRLPFPDGSRRHRCHRRHDLRHLRQWRHAADQSDHHRQHRFNLDDHRGGVLWRPDRQGVRHGRQCYRPHVTSDRYGIYLRAGGLLTNTGSIFGGSNGVKGEHITAILGIDSFTYNTATSTLVNSGSIGGGGGYAVQFERCGGAVTAIPIAARSVPAKFRHRRQY